MSNMIAISVASARPQLSAKAILRRAALWFTVARERRDLRGLDAHLLADIGCNPVDAARESARPFWDLPVGRSN